MLPTPSVIMLVFSSSWLFQLESQLRDHLNLGSGSEVWYLVPTFSTSSVSSVKILSSPISIFRSFFFCFFHSPSRCRSRGGRGVNLPPPKDCPADSEILRKGVADRLQALQIMSPPQPKYLDPPLPSLPNFAVSEFQGQRRVPNLQTVCMCSVLQMTLSRW